MGPVFLVGVDGGGTNCRARVRLADGPLVGEASSGTANILAGQELARDSVLAAVTRALAAGGRRADDLAACVVGLGLAGANVPGFAESFRSLDFPFRAVAIESDAFVACRGAHAGADGAIAILGTGTAYVVKTGDRFTSLGGWGSQISDHGSGAWLGRRAMADALLALDAIVPATPFLRALLDRFEGDPERMVRFAASALPRDYGTFGPLLVEHIEACDPAALAILREGLATIELTLDRVFALGAPRVALMGGLAPHYRRFLRPDLLERVSEPVADAMEGAIELARTALREDFTP
ncbi:glucosamine kinase [Faunimonas pinastri]|uniref:Glucosamine kinase n=1 Tax=Faunimonas pinastri TaxID=1855383 RepID=A0A1H9ABP8_9HYPH|nr:BadF/BadG/BcrA/BcrD ATPase family protein [Faunimonas pinastri]SEP74090.1 glucosamine kinase [Faunimonas pinastri]